MILRLVRGRVADADTEAVQAAARGPFAAVAGSTPGLDRFHVAVRPAPEGGQELVVMTIWSTVDDALRAYDGDLDAVRTLPGLPDVADLREVSYFELDEELPRRAGVAPAFLRLSAGRVARGADAEIQQALRLRMAELGPFVTEGWVARRIVGTDVEIAFISAWEGEDPAHPLDVAMWPDISAQYDAFEVSVYRPMASGPGN